MNSRGFRFAAFAAALALLGPVARAAGPDLSPWVALARGRVEPPGGIVLVGASRDGLVKELLADEGDVVAKDAPLAAMDDRSARLTRDLAASELAQAQAAAAPLQLRQTAAAREVRRLEQLVSEQLANAQDLDQARDHAAEIAAGISQAEAAENSARARLALAEHEVDVCVVRAPVAGQIVRRLGAVGQAFSIQGGPLFWLAPNGPRVVIAQLDEEAVRVVTLGQHAEVITDSEPGRVISATVQRVGLIFGPRRPATDDPAERQDVRVVDCVVALGDATPPLLIGQRVVVRFLRTGASGK